MNIRAEKDDLLPCRFGACLKHLINWIIAARKKFPGKKIVSSKIDYKLAYRQFHLNANTATQTCTQLPEEDLEIVALSLTFGGVPGPHEWGVLSESICDFSFAIMQDAGWDPTSLCANNGHLVPPPLFLDDYIPFAEGKVLIIDVPVDERGTAEVYIEYTISVTVDIKDSNNVQRFKQVSILAIHFDAQENTQ